MSEEKGGALKSIIFIAAVVIGIGAMMFFKSQAKQKKFNNPEVGHIYILAEGDEFFPRKIKEIKGDTFIFFRGQYKYEGEVDMADVKSDPDMFVEDDLEWYTKTELQELWDAGSSEMHIYTIENP